MIPILIEYMVALYDSVICVWFISRYNAPNKKAGKSVDLLAIVVIFLYTLFSDKYLSGFNIASTLIFLALYIVYSLVIVKRSYLKAAFSGCVFEIVFVLLSTIIYLLISVSISNFDSIMQGEVGVFRNMYIVLHKISLFFVLKLILGISKAEQKTLSIKAALLSYLLTFISIVGIYFTMYWVSLFPSASIYTSAIVITVVFIISNVILYILIDLIQKHQNDIHELQLLHAKMIFEKQRYDEAVEIWTHAQKIRHDVKQHLTIISNYLEDGETKECKEYLNNWIPNINSDKKIVSSDNIILDYLINTKLSHLESTEILISGNIGDLSDIKDYDLACLIGNILDNATEAITALPDSIKTKRIEILFNSQNSNRVIICKNTIANSVLEGNKHLKSHKKDGKTHGYGLKIIKKIVADYNGLVDFFEDGDMFGVEILLPVTNKES